jgi:hypothetical protein
MRNKFVLLGVLLALALVAAACGGQDTTREPGAVTPNATAITENSAATEAATGADMTPTEAAEENTPTAEPGATDQPPATEAAGTAGIPQTGPGNAGLPDDLDEVIRVLRETGVPVTLADPVESDVLTVPGQIVLIDTEEVEFYTYESAEQVEAQAPLVADLVNPQGQPQFYKLGTMIVRYAGSNTLVRDLLEDVLGAQEAGQ